MTISYNDAYQKSLDYFHNDNLAAQIWVDKYALRDNNKNILEDSPVAMHRRLAKEFARIEKNKFRKPFTEDELFDFFDKFKYIIPQGGILYGLGNPYQYVTLSNCYAIDTPEDSYGGICWSDEQLVQISKRRGGCGTNLSKLRPARASTQNSSRTSTGPISFAERFSHSIREVGQDGRRGALMLMMHCIHPDIIDFIKCKSDKTKITGANISVGLFDDFIKKALSNQLYIQQWPISGKAKISKEVSAKNVWDTMIQNAWESAEPGALFWDTIIRESVSDCYANFGFETIATNPSLRADTLVLTNNGIFPIKQLAETTPNITILNCNKEWKDAKVFCSGKNKQLVKITFQNNQTVFCTKEHKWPVLNTLNNLYNKHTGKVIKKVSIDLQKQDKIYFPNITNPIDNKKCKFTKEDGFVLGWLYGDGWQSWHITQNKLVLGFIFNKEDVKCGIANRVLNYTNNIAKIPSTIKQDHESQSWTYQTSDPMVIKHFKELGADYKENGLPKTLWSGNSNFIHGFIDGLYSSDGYVECNNKPSNNRIILTTSRILISQQLQQLLSFYGIKSNIRHQTSRLKNRTKIYHRYDLQISGLHSKKFADIFILSNDKNNTLQQIKNQSFDNYSNTREYLVVKTVELTDIYEDVYDITVDDDTHTFMTEVGITGNCSELPLPPLDSCRLLLLNLYSFVEKPFTKDAYFNFDKFYKYAQIAQRLMDDVIDLELECINRIISKIKTDPEEDKLKERELNLWYRVREMCTNGRRTGTGFTALADTLAALGYKYGDDKSLAITDRIAKTLKFGCYRSSVDMAKELTPFPIFNYELEKDNPFLNRVKNEELWLSPNNIDSPGFISGSELYEDMKKYGRRNIACLTLSPAGTISIETQTTSGGEPALYLVAKRRKKGNLHDDNFRVDFVDQNGDSWMEFEFEHPKLTEWKKITGETDITKSPWYGCCAEDLNYSQRIKLQATIQKHIDHSISSTINLPEDTTIETVGMIYEEAWKSGCKGITIYRKNCRTGVILDNSKTDIVKRPKELPCDVYHVSVKGQGYFILVGLMNNKPYEVFSGKNGVISQNIKVGKIIRKKKGFYKAIFEDDDTELSPITSFCTDAEEAITRLLSTSLRAEVDLNLIVTQLEKVGGNSAEIHGFAKAISRTLKKYIKDGSKIEGEQCPECKSSLVRKNGCWCCSKEGCTFTKCV